MKQAQKARRLCLWGLNPLQEVGVMKLRLSTGVRGMECLNPLQEVGVMKPIGSGLSHPWAES